MNVPSFPWITANELLLDLRSASAMLFSRSLASARLCMNESLLDCRLGSSSCSSLTVAAARVSIGETLVVLDMFT